MCKHRAFRLLITTLIAFFHFAQRDVQFGIVLQSLFIHLSSRLFVYHKKLFKRNQKGIRRKSSQLAPPMICQLAERSVFTSVTKISYS